VEHIEVRFHIGAGGSSRELYFGSDGRSLVRKCLDDLPRRLFWRDEHSGAQLTDYPTIRWGGGRGVIRLFGLCPDDVALVERHILRIGSGLKVLIGHPIRIEIVNHQVELELSNQIQAYDVFHTIVDHPKKRRSWAAASQLDRIATIETAVVSGIRRQADATGVPVPAGMKIFLARDQEIQFVPARFANSGSGLFTPCAQQVRFQANVRIRGIWAAGHVSSKGFGRIAPAQGWGRGP
jgi:hypothetical protein